MNAGSARQAETCERRGQGRRRRPAPARTCACLRTRETSAAMQLLSDFDGVWTYPDQEGAAHGAALDASLLAAAGDADRDAARAWIAEARRAVRSAPERWGWSAAGRLSAFADEDPFTEHG